MRQRSGGVRSFEKVAFLYDTVYDINSGGKKYDEEENYYIGMHSDVHGYDI